jgi:hypothetical protein
MPHASSHSKLRYTQRAGLDAPSMTEAWCEGVAVELDDWEYERARHHEGADVVLVERDGVIVTVISATHETIDE